MADLQVHGDGLDEAALVIAQVRAAVSDAGGTAAGGLRMAAGVVSHAGLRAGLERAADAGRDAHAVLGSGLESLAAFTQNVGVQFGAADATLAEDAS